MAHPHHGRQDAVSLNIKISKRGIERTFYWVVILVLAILLIISYVSDKEECEPSSNVTANVAVDTTSDTSGTSGDTTSQDPIAVDDTSGDDVLPLPAKIDVQPEPDPEPDPDPVPDPEPEPELSGIVEFEVPLSGIKTEDLDTKVKITQITVKVDNGKTFALEGYKALVYAYGDDEKSAAVKSKVRVEKDGFVIPVTKSGGKKDMQIDLSTESIFNVVNEVIIKVKFYDDRNKLLDSITINKRV